MFQRANRSLLLCHSTSVLVRPYLSLDQKVDSSLVKAHGLGRLRSSKNSRKNLEKHRCILNIYIEEMIHRRESVTSKNGSVYEGIE